MNIKPLQFNSFFLFIGLLGFTIFPNLLQNLETQNDDIKSDQESHIKEYITNSITNNLATADLELSMTVSESAPLIYTNTTYTLSVTNTGPEDAASVVIDFSQPDGMAFTSSTPSSGSYSNWNGEWKNFGVASGETATLEVELFTLTEDPVYAFAQVKQSSEDDPDSTPDNNSGIIPNEDDEAAATLNLADVSLEFLQSSYSVNPGNEFTINLELTNNGPSSTRLTRVLFPLPQGVTLISYGSDSNPNWVVYGQDGLWYINRELQSGEVEDIRINVRLAGNATNDLDLFAEVIQSSSQDPDSAPNNGNAPNPNEDDEARSLIDVGGTQDLRPDISLNQILNEPTSLDAGESGSLQIQFENIGLSGITSTFQNTLYLSTDVSFSNNDIVLDAITQNTPLEIGQEETRSFFFDIPANTNPGFYYFLAYADSEDDIDEPNNTNNFYVRSIQITGQNNDLPNLQLNDFNIASEGDQGEVINYTFDLINNGQVDVNGDYEIGVYLSNDGTVSNDDVLVGNVSTGNTPIGTTSNVPGQITIPPNQNPGEYFIIMTADINNAISETDETDNQSEFFSFTVNEIDNGSGVDLSLSLNVGNINPSIYTNVFYTLSIFNEGDEDATNVEVDFQVPDGLAFTSQSVTAGSYSNWNGKWNVGTVEAGSVETLSLILFALNTDPITNYAQITRANEPDVDSTPNNGSCCVVNEDDEAVVTLNGAGGLPDLVVSDVSGLPTSVETSEIFFIDVTVTNIGTAPATQGGLLQILFNGNQLGIWTPDTTFDLQPGESYTYTDVQVTVFESVTVELELTFIIDIFADLDESNESNNTFTATIPVVNGLPDLVISDVGGLPNSVETFETFLIDVTVTNIGTAPATQGGLLQILVNSGQLGILSPQTTFDLQPGESYTYTDIEVTVFEFVTDELELSFFIDIFNNLEESNESNNNYIATVPVVNGLPDLVVSEVSGLPNSVETFEQFTIDVTVTNIGTAPATQGGPLQILFNSNQLGIWTPQTTFDLQPGESYTYTDVEVTVFEFITDELALTFIIDIFDELDESDESNNILIETIPIVNTKPDFVIGQLNATPTTLVPGETITVSYVVGSLYIPGPATDVAFTLSENGTNQATVIASQTIAPITEVITPVPYTYELTIPNTFTPGQYTLGATIDFSNTVEELVETNNAVFTQLVLEGDNGGLVLNEISCPNEYAVPGGQLTYDLSFTNNSTTTSSARTLYFFQNIFLSVDPFGGDLLYGEVEIPQVAPGQTIDVTLIATLPERLIPPGTFEGDFRQIRDFYFTFNSEAGEPLEYVDVFCNKTQADIAIDISTDDPSISSDGGEVSYTYTVTNNGPETAHYIIANLGVSGSLPGVFLSTNEPPVGYRFQSGSSFLNVGWIIPSLASGESISYELSNFILALQNPDPAEYTVTRSISAPSVIDPNEDNNSDSQLFTRAPNMVTTDLELQLITDDPTVNGGTVQFSYIVSNNGPENAEDIRVYLGLNGLSVGTFLNYGEPPAGTLVTETGPFLAVVTWEIPNLAAGESLQLDVNRLLQSAPPFPETYTVERSIEAPSVNDPNLDNNTDELVFGPSGEGIDLSMTLFAVNSTFNIYERVNIVVNVFNEESVDATGVIIDLPRPEGLVFTSQDATQGEYNSWLQEWDVGTIPANTTATLELTLFTLADDAPFNIYGQVKTANENDVDSTPGNGTCCTLNEDDEALDIISPANQANLAFRQLEKRQLTRLISSYPNPTTDYLIINLESEADLNITLDLYDARGNYVMSKNFEAFKGENQSYIEVNDLPSGMYTVHIKDAYNKNSILKFVKQE